MSICKVDISRASFNLSFTISISQCRYVSLVIDLDLCAPSRHLRCGFDCCKLLCVAVLQWWQGSVSMIVSDIEAAACGRSWLHPAPAPGQEAPGTQPSSAVALVTVLHDCCHALARTNHQHNTRHQTKPPPRGGTRTRAKSHGTSVGCGLVLVGNWRENGSGVLAG